MSLIYLDWSGNFVLDELLWGCDISKDLMVQIKRCCRMIFSSLLCLPMVAVVSSFSITSLRPKKQSTSIFSESNVDKLTTSFRRKFISSCVAVVTYGAISIPSSYSITTILPPSIDNDASYDAISVYQRLLTSSMIIGEEDNISATSSELKPAAASAAKATDDQQPSINAFQESISGFVSGSVVSVAKTIIKYPLDTATVRLQMPNTKYTLLDLPALFDGSFDGITAPLLSNIPSSGVFFAVKDVTKSALKSTSLSSDLPKWATTALAVGAAQPLYWALRNPSEVIKTRLQVGAEGYYEGMSTIDAFKLAINGTNGGGVTELFRGYSENILYAYPADLIKFGAYEFLSEIGKGKQNKNMKIVVSPAEGAVYGALSTGIAQLLTTPLDVVRNRIMAANGEKEKEDARAATTITITPSYIERLTTIAREEGIGALFAGSFPRLGKALLSGAIQFATYEETKQKMGEFFIKR